MGEAIRVYNLVSAVVLLGLTIVAIVWRWRRMDPVERLFSLSLLGYFVYALATTTYGLVMGTEFRWYTVVLMVSNIWMIVCVFVLSRREHPEEVLSAAAERD